MICIVGVILKQLLREWVLLKHLSHCGGLGAARCAWSGSLNYLSSRAIKWCREEVWQTMEASHEARPWFSVGTQTITESLHKLTIIIIKWLGVLPLFFYYFVCLCIYLSCSTIISTTFPLNIDEELEPITAVIRWEAGFTLDRSMRGRLLFLFLFLFYYLNYCSFSKWGNHYFSQELFWIQWQILVAIY